MINPKLRSWLFVSVLCALITACGSGSNSSSEVDPKISASVNCVVTELKNKDIYVEQELSAYSKLLTVNANSYFYYDERVTVTNYSDSDTDIYVEYRLVDANGKVFDTANFREYVGAGETQTFSSNEIVKSARAVVLFNNSSLLKTWFDCPVVMSTL